MYVSRPHKMTMYVCTSSHVKIMGATLILLGNPMKLTLGMNLIACGSTGLPSSCMTDDTCMLLHTSQSLSTSRQDIQHCLPKNIVFTGDDVALISARHTHTHTHTHTHGHPHKFVSGAVDHLNNLVVGYTAH